MTTLKQARDSGKIDQFVKEREGQETDPEAFNRALEAMARTSKEAQGTSKKPDRGD